MFIKLFPNPTLTTLLYSPAFRLLHFHDFHNSTEHRKASQRQRALCAFGSVFLQFIIGLLIERCVVGPRVRVAFARKFRYTAVLYTNLPTYTRTHTQINTAK